MDDINESLRDDDVPGNVIRINDHNDNPVIVNELQEDEVDNLLCLVAACP